MIWDELLTHGGSISPFLRSWWLDAVREQPLTVLCWEAERLIGGLALEVDLLGVRRLRAPGAGALAPDHLDLLALPGRESEVTEAVLAWLREQGNLVVDLDGLSADGRLARALPGEVTRYGAPFADISAGADAYLAARPGQVRSTIKRTTKRLAAQGAVVRRVGPAEIEVGLERLRALHDSRWSEDSGFLDAWPRFARAARAGLGRGEAVLHELVVDGDLVIATEFDLVLDERLAFYQAGRLPDRDWRGAGSVLRAGIIEWAANQGFTEYDLLRGEEGYKSDWATGVRELVRVRTGFGAGGRSIAGAAGGWHRFAQWAVHDLRPRLEAVAHRAGPTSTSD